MKPGDAKLRANERRCFFTERDDAVKVLATNSDWT